MMQQGVPPMPKKKAPKRGGIAAMIQSILDRGRSAGRPPIGDMVPGAPRPQPVDEYELRFGGDREFRRPPITDLNPADPIRRPTLRKFVRPLGGSR